MERGSNRKLVPEDRDRFAWNIPDRFNIAERCCDSWAEIDPDRVAMTDINAAGTAHDVTFAMLRDRSDRLATALRGLGVERGDRVALLLSQGPEALIGHFATMKIGAIALPLFTLFGPDALRYRLGDSGAKVAITDGENLDKLISVSNDLPGLRHVICTEVQDKVTQLDELIERAAPLPERIETSPDDPAMMIYTSGTTGSPKGVLHAHRFLLGHLPCFEVNHDALRDGDVGWTPADWAWIGGLMDLAMPCLYYGIRLVSHRMRKFEAEGAWSLVAYQDVTRLFLPPAALRMMRRVPVPEGVRVRSISSGGEALGADLLDWGRETLGAAINELYGQTECNLVAASDAAHGVQRPGSVGRAVPGHRVAVLDDEAQPVWNTLGEIAVRRPDPGMFLRYWNQPEKTEAKFTGDWMRTGDLGRMDGDGYLTFVSRDDDVINSSGYRVGPTEIEDCLLRHEAVASAAVVGLPDPQRGQAITAFVVRSEGAEDEDLADRLITHVRDALGPYVAPRVVHFRDSLPMTTTGKIMRRALREEKG
ncbi:AMP-binding protein [Palleronia sp. LCG004]|uniref:AMP-binding protein n=1 Tax=Palleronia sp. LCG004 TaxID=3079304 RepID=UPI0029435A8C|nr:AMP-binding protein [Palleronia sp. LCG004]WOI57259.1 AMP-binding protein [Palleronia sp. LCG004]